MNTCRRLGCLLLVLTLAVTGCNPTVCSTAANASKAAAPASGQPVISAQEAADGWIALFDGETLFGWEPAGKADWQVKDGVIAVSSGDPSLLLTTSPFADFALKVDFRAAKGTNSGLFLRCANKEPDVTTQAYELNIAPSDNPFPTGSFVKRKKGEAVEEKAEWQTYEVTAEGGHFAVKLDGRAVLDYADPKPIVRGTIGLQHNSGKVEFRNVKLKPLRLASIFNGKDFKGWKTYPDMKSVFSVTPEGLMNVKNGRGQIETEGRYADFTLQLDVFVNGKALNSGVFYRCIPGEQMNGYETQIQNGFVDGDRTKPADCGTGGIFRRVSARKVVSDDFQWFTMTIQPVGAHVSVWVNGYQVTDWSDDRKPDPNLRKGLRLEPGSIMLQGHDPTTDINFRNIRIAELPQ